MRGGPACLRFLSRVEDGAPAEKASRPGPVRSGRELLIAVSSVDGTLTKITKKTRVVVSLKADSATE